MPLLTRIYSPESFGVLSVFTSFVGIVAPLASFRYDIVLPLPKRDSVALNVFVFAALTILITSLLVAVVLFPLHEALFERMNVPELIRWWWCIPIGILGRATYDLLRFWGTRCREYKTIAKTRITQGILGSGTKIALGMLGFQSLGLIFGQILAQASGIGALLRGFSKSLLAYRRSLRFGRMLVVASHYRNFPIFRMPSELMLAVAMQTPLLSFANIYGAEISGQLGLALMAIGLPVGLVSQSAGQALYGEAAIIKKNDPQLLPNLAWVLQKKLFLIAIVPTLLLFFFGEWFFKFVFGDTWSTAGMYASILSVSMLFQFTSGPLMQLINLVGSQSYILLLNTIRLVLTLSVFFVAKQFDWQPSLTLSIYSGLLAAFYLSASIMVFRLVRRKTKCKVLV